MGSRYAAIGWFVSGVIAAGAFVWLSPVPPNALGGSKLQTAAGSERKDSHGHGDQGEHGSEEVVRLTADQIAAAKIAVSDVQGGILARRLTVPGTVVADADRLVRVGAKTPGTVAELRKRLGDSVVEGDLLGVLESREVADAKSQFLAALLTHGLQQTLFEREKSLWEKRVSTEQAFLRAQAATDESQIKLDVARQKLAALGFEEREIADLRQQPISALRRHELRSPIAGRVIERKVNVGAPVIPETELFVIADLSEVWVELSVSPADLPFVKDGQPVTVSNGASTEEGVGKVIFISPLLDNETRTARVVASVNNKSGIWRPGTFVKAKVLTEEIKANVVVPPSAIQTIEGESVVFVRTEDGFEKREIVVGLRDENSVEVVFGLDAGEAIATENTFILKAELGKREAEHSHAH